MTGSARTVWVPTILGWLWASWLLHSLAAFATDDAYITLRYARHLAEGYGLRWNPGGEVVEGYSNFLHVLLGAAAMPLGTEPFLVLRSINIVAWMGLIAFVPFIALRLGSGRLVAGGSALVVAIHVPMAYWAVSGLETTLSGLLTTVALALYALGRGYRGQLGLAGALLLASLCRPEVAVLAVVLALMDGARQLRARHDLAWSALLGRWLRESLWIPVFGAIYGAYFAWRWIYFGYPLPNTAYAKGDTTRQGELLIEFVIQNPLLLALAWLGWLVSRERERQPWAAAILTYMLLLWNVHPSVADLHRFLLPIWPALVILAALGVDALLKRLLDGPRAHWIAACGLLVMQLSLERWHPQAGLAEAERRVAALSGRTEAREALANWLRQRAKPDDRIAIGDIGLVGYRLSNPIVDLFGLNDVDFAHRFNRDRQPYALSLLQTKPEFIVVVSKHPEKFEHKYKTDTYLLDAPGFDDDYALRTRIEAPRGRYSYWVYGRRVDR